MMKQLMKEDDVVKEVVTSEDVSAIFSVVEQLLAVPSLLSPILGPPLPSLSPFMYLSPSPPRIAHKSFLF